MNERLRVLITGFGPFPGAPFNPTMPLVGRLTQLRRPSLDEVELAGHIFHVTYQTVDRELPEPALFVSGTVSNQGRFRSRFDAVVLLSAPAEVLLARLEARTTNDYGKAADERDEVLRHLAQVEPLLRASCTHELDARLPLDEVVCELAAIGRGQ